MILLNKLTNHILENVSFRPDIQKNITDKYILHYSEGSGCLRVETSYQYFLYIINIPSHQTYEVQLLCHEFFAEMVNKNSTMSFEIHEEEEGRFILVITGEFEETLKLYALEERPKKQKDLDQSIKLGENYYMPELEEITGF